MDTYRIKPEMPTMTLEDKRKALAEKEKAKASAVDAERLAQEEALIDAKLKALDEYLPEQLFEAEVAAVGPMLFHTPTDLAYDAFMKSSGAIKGDLSKNTPQTAEYLIAQCVIYPEAKVALEKLRTRNPHARTIIASKILEVMRGKLAEEGK